MEYWVQSSQVMNLGCAFVGTVWTCTGPTTAHESPVLQWGIRPGGTCNSGFTSLGMDGAFGSGGHFVSTSTAATTTTTTTTAVVAVAAEDWKLGCDSHHFFGMLK